MPRPGHVPRLCHHRHRQLGYVTIAGKPVYFQGPWPAGQKKPPRPIQKQYDDYIARWLAGRNTQPERVGPRPTLDELWLGYRAFVEGPTIYTKHGKKTSESMTITAACRVVARLFGGQLAETFTAKQLEAVREEFVTLGWSRKHINKQLKRVRGMFRWGVRQDLLPEGILTRLETVPGISKAEAKARAIPLEEKVRPVRRAVVEATLAATDDQGRPFVPPILAAMVRVHWLLGCRAEDVVLLRTCDIDFDADPDGAPGGRAWLWTPTDAATGRATSKTENVEDKRELTYWIGPPCQKLLEPLLDREHPTAYVFPTARRGKSPARAWNGRYSTPSYRRAVTRCIDKINAYRQGKAEADARKHPGRPRRDPELLPRWTPLQIRHGRLSEIRAFAAGHGLVGAEAAQAVAGHEQLSTTEIYAEKSAALARRVMRELG